MSPKEERKTISEGFGGCIILGTENPNDMKPIQVSFEDENGEWKDIKELAQ